MGDVILFSDFGSADLYLGQVKAVIRREAPEVVAIDLLNDVPPFDIEAGAHLLAALAHSFAAGSVFLAVVDPGVGGARRPVTVRADGKWFVGPDNGLLSIVAQRSREAQAWQIVWHPRQLSASFHGRDLFAPIAAILARDGRAPTDKLHATPRLDVLFPPDGLSKIIYVDHYGNCLTGLPAAGMRAETVLQCGGRRLHHANTFSDVEEGHAFWYANSVGLVEFAVNRGDAARMLGVGVGAPILVF